MAVSDASQLSLSDLRAKADQLRRLLVAVTDTRVTAALEKYLMELEDRIGDRESAE
jgi:hypothetical protein